MLEKLFGIFSKKQFSSIESSTLNLQKDLISYPALAIIRKLKSLVGTHLLWAGLLEIFY